MYYSERKLINGIKRLKIQSIDIARKDAIALLEDVGLNALTT